MKKLSVIFVLVLLSLTTFAQSKWDGFFQPVTSEHFSEVIKDLNEPANSVWLFRPTVGITAIQLAWNKDLKKFDASSLNSVGPGLSYNHYVLVDGEPYNNFGVNALILFDVIPTETTVTNVSILGTISVFQYINIGGGYSFGLNQFIALSGVTLKF